MYLGEEFILTPSPLFPYSSMVSSDTKQPKEIIAERLVDKTVPFRPSVYRLVHIMRAMEGETVAACIERIVLDAYSRTKHK